MEYIHIICFLLVTMLSKGQGVGNPGIDTTNNLVGKGKGKPNIVYVPIPEIIDTDPVNFYPFQPHFELHMEFPANEIEASALPKSERDAWFAKRARAEAQTVKAANKLHLDQFPNLKETDPRTYARMGGTFGRREFVANNGKIYEFDDTLKASFIGGGSFGKVFKATAVSDPSDIICVKHRLFENVNAPFAQENQIMGTQNMFLGWDEKRQLVGMPYIKGRSLKDIWSNEGLTPEEQNKLLARAMTKLTSLHNQGYVHRDLKDENILISYDKQDVFLIDFGIAEPINNWDNDPAEKRAIVYTDINRIRSAIAGYQRNY